MALSDPLANIDFEQLILELEKTIDPMLELLSEHYSNLTGEDLNLQQDAFHRDSKDFTNNHVYRRF